MEFVLKNSKIVSQISFVVSTVFFPHDEDVTK